MTFTSIVRFDEAFAHARAILAAHAGRLGGRFVLIRDVQGCISVLTDIAPGADATALAQALSTQLGAFGGTPEEVLLFPDDFFDAERLFRSPDARPLFPPGHDEAVAGHVLLLEREITGLDWMRAPLPVPDASGKEAPRMTFFGVKGGVGRSTALTLAARALARAGSRVLIVDLDLESPGLGPLLLPADSTPRFGILDYLVEEAVGQDDDALLSDMVARSPLVEPDRGAILVAPATGVGGHYLAKLGRAYQSAASTDGARELAERVDRMISRLSRREDADVVLIDSRAGLHDVAAFAVTRLRAQSLLFGAAAEPMFHGYRLLFEEWRDHPNLSAFRDKLRMVAALVPEADRTAYLDRFLAASHHLFSTTLYEAAPAQVAGGEARFHFDLHDATAPHHPLAISWSRALQEFDPVSRPGAAPDARVIEAAGAFCSQVGALLKREVAL
ncbi:KGGVGR-motif variant AAA ATPase [Chondromyces crocatus]|uniref:CobQ/CobB/MinD/ParA nucleotide binding domain-containing protein n=1 Tax=Chondromyces crocatus TaxID=52 RepID=A0A0K1EIT7_CHOCO|nr:hypothetical protein [Chondromyces crocatus]AKT40572.1 uncharacterized protein CMC5_047280 [Chondromyces crocatus]